MATPHEEPPPVLVIEKVPVAGEQPIDARTLRIQGIPTPPHLVVYPELGSGAMGHVHPATDRNLLRHVALKRLDRDLVGEPMYRGGFIAEAQMTGQLEHPNIVPVHDLGFSEAGVPYFTMKLVQGINLDRWLRAHPLGDPARLSEGLEILLKVCDAVAYAHHRGVVHRDLKPENIMVAEFGQVYVMDWGLARLTKTRPASGQASQMEAPGAVGTPGYLSPEQARGKPAEMDERSDVFGIGAMLYEIVSGRLPYGPDVRKHLALAEQGRVYPIATTGVNLGVARGIGAIADRATAADPLHRYQTVLALQREIRQFLRGGLHLPQASFESGTVIVQEGDVGDAAFMIVQGHCRVYRTDAGRQETLQTLGPGDVFGEMALILDEPRAASVVAEDQVTALVLDQETMHEGLGLDGWTGALVRALAQRFHDLELRVRRAGLSRA
ncbi:MAG: protein kinase [Polyangiaceae bacterium]|nr:protein kinase [Polyangiaceae bacterium]